jgi:hypothetical protein
MFTTIRPAGVAVLRHGYTLTVAFQLELDRDILALVDAAPPEKRARHGEAANPHVRIDLLANAARAADAVARLIAADAGASLILGGAMSREALVIPGTRVSEEVDENLRRVEGRVPGAHAAEDEDTLSGIDRVPRDEPCSGVASTDRTHVDVLREGVRHGIEEVGRGQIVWRGRVVSVESTRE